MSKFVKILIISFILFCIISIFLCYWVYSQNIPDVKIPGIAVKSITFNEDFGLFEVIAANNTLFYLTKDGKYAIFGNIIDTRTLKNLTDERKREVFKIDFKTLPLQDAIKFGNGKKKLAIFSSPFCSWCRKLHEEFKKLDDFTIYVFISPLGDINVLKTILCNNETLNDAYSGNMPKVGKTDCEKANILQRNAELMKKVYISSFPTIIFESGKTFTGYVPAEKIREEALK